MFEIVWKDQQLMTEETQENFKLIEGIDKIIDLQKQLFHTDDEFVCFGDAQIDGLEYPPAHDKLTVYIEYAYNNIFCEKKAKSVHYVIDFCNPEIFCFDIEFNTHWIDDIIIQKNNDGKYNISFGSGGLDFQYTSAKVNRCWIDYEK